MPRSLKVLIVEDSLNDTELLVRELRNAGFNPDWKRVETERDYRAGLEDSPHLIISDYTMPQFDGLRAMELLRERGLDIPFILLSGTVGEEIAVEAMKRGATDYLFKDRIGRLRNAVERALEQKRLRDERGRMKQQLEERNIELEQRIRLAALSAGVGAALIHGNTLREVLQGCCQAFVQHLDAAFARIWTYNERENVLELQASAGMDTHLDGPHGRVPVGKINIGLIAEERKPYFTNSVIGDPRIPEQEWVRREGLVAFAGYPLAIGDRVVGVMAIFAGHPLPQTTLDAMASIADGVVLGIERKRSEEELHIAHAQLRHLLDHTPAVIYALRVEGEKVVPHVVGENIARLLGFNVPETLRCEWWTGQLHPQDRDMAIASVAETLAHGTSLTEYRLRHKNGHYRWLEDNRRVSYGLSNRPVEIVGVWMDITERKLAEAALRASEERFALALQGSNDGIWDWNLDTDAVYYSPRWKSMLGYSNNELENHLDTWKRLVHPEDRTTTLALVTDLIEGRAGRFEAEFRMRHKDGHVVHILSRAFFFDGGGKVRRLVGTHVDISERKRAEFELEQMHTQLVAVSRQAGMAEFATGILHNVGNVLNSVNVATTCLSDSLKKSKSTSLVKVVALMRQHDAALGDFFTHDPKGKQVPGYLAQLADHLAGEQTAALKELGGLRRNVEHIMNIIAVQQDSAKMSRLPELLNLADLAEDALAMNANGLTRATIHVNKEFEEVPPIMTERHMVLQILVNLVRNAMQACDATGGQEKRLAIRISQDGDRARIAVADNGSGISPENLSRIFTQGFTTKKDGHGFGLHSAVLAAKEMGGSLTVQSDGPGRGATFTLELPMKHCEKPL